MKDCAASPAFSWRRPTARIPNTMTPGTRRRKSQKVPCRTVRSPYEFQRGDLPAGLVPKGAEVLVAFQNPSDAQMKMVFVRIRDELPAALAQIRKQYVGEGWQWAGPPADSKKDAGWLMRFTQEHRTRLVYAQERPTGKETLAMIYDSVY